MNIEEFTAHCLTHHGAEETYPFGDQALWFKVKGKAFAWTFVKDYKMQGEMRPPYFFVNLKCDPEQAIGWREEHSSVEPGWHQSKKHWNTVFTEDLPPNFKEMITHAYEVVVSGLTKKLREELAGEK